MLAHLALVMKGRRRTIDWIRFHQHLADIVQRATGGVADLVELIRSNLRSLQITEGFEVMEREAEPALRLLDAQAVLCDFCFLDPPYQLSDEYEQALGFLSQSRLLKPESIIIAEHDKRFDPGDKFGALERYRVLRQGDAALSFYRLK